MNKGAGTKIDKCPDGTETLRKIVIHIFFNYRYHFKK